MNTKLENNSREDKILPCCRNHSKHWLGLPALEIKSGHLGWVWKHSPLKVANVLSLGIQCRRQGGAQPQAHDLEGVQARCPHAGNPIPPCLLPGAFGPQSLSSSCRHIPGSLAQWLPGQSWGHAPAKGHVS